MARSLEPLVVGKVIGDVVDMFSPAAEFTVQYGPKQVTNGCEIKPSAAADKPKVQILGPRVPSNHYTLVMVDPDAPSPSEPTLREWLHSAVVDIPEGLDATKGRELVPYAGPQPPAGIHRYVLVLFGQRDPTLTKVHLSAPANLLPTINLAFQLLLSILIHRRNLLPENEHDRIFLARLKMMIWMAVFVYTIQLVAYVNEGLGLLNIDCDP